MSHDRNLTYLNNKRLIYRRHPVSDKPDIDTKEFMYFENGTHQCYELFRSTAKITTYRSLKWHLLVLWYLNPNLNQDDFIQLAEYIVHKPNGFVSFNVSERLLEKVVYEVSMSDLDRPPKNKLRKVIFKPNFAKISLYCSNTVPTPAPIIVFSYPCSGLSFVTLLSE